MISHFNSCPMVWMCPARDSNNKINNKHERALRMVDEDKKFSFKTILKNYKSSEIHKKNLQYMATELFKVMNFFSPETMKEMFLFS